MYRINSRYRPSAVSTDPRMRGAWTDYIRRRTGGAFNAPGIDTNRSQQWRSAMDGAQKAIRAAYQPRYTLGQRMQNTIRNRSAEQPRSTQPAQPSTGIRYAPSPHPGFTGNVARGSMFDRSGGFQAGAQRPVASPGYQVRPGFRLGGRR